MATTKESDVVFKPNEYGCSETGGVKVMNIEGRMAYQRERMIGMTDAERRWRQQWLKDQVLHNEPILDEKYYKLRYNPIRRFYRKPLNILESSLVPMLGKDYASLVRHIIAKTGFGLLFAYGAFYYLKYNQGDWTRIGGWKVTHNRTVMYPSHPNYPNFKETKPHEYATLGFEKSPI